MPLFPPGIIFEIAAHVQKDADLATLNSINRLCKMAHQVTLPLLYESFVLGDRKGLPWQEILSSASDGWKHTRWVPSGPKTSDSEWWLTLPMIYRFLLVHENLFTDIHEFASSHPSNASQTDPSLDFVFPRLVLGLVLRHPLNDIMVDGQTRETPATPLYQLHIYGSISSPKLVYACRFPPLRSYRDESDHDSDCASDGSHPEADSTDDENVDDIDINLVVLHNHARLIKEDRMIFPCLDVDVYFEIYGRTLDLRLLATNENLQDTLEGCMWLLNEGNTSCESVEKEDVMSKNTRVLCPWDMIQRVADTVSPDPRIFPKIRIPHCTAINSFEHKYRSRSSSTSARYATDLSVT